MCTTKAAVNAVIKCLKEMTAKAITTSSSTKMLQVLDTELYADSVEWSPFEEFKTLLICGTYQLTEGSKDHSNSTSERLGHLNLYQLTDLNQLTLKCSVSGAGILDTKWCPEITGDTFPLIGVANSLGCVELHKIKKTNSDIFLEKLQAIPIEDNGLALSLDWQTSNTTQLVVSTSLGNISVQQIKGGQAETVLKWTGHLYEAWICAFDRWNSNLIFTGGDDCKLLVWDLRNRPIKPTSTLTRHSMGVTSIQSNPHQEHVLCTGSYDETILFWDNRNFKQCLASHNVGGGVWRVKWDPLEGCYVAAACMHNGSHIVRLDKDNVTYSAVSFLDQQSLTYGIDWLHKTDDTNTSRDERCFTLASCSFYDHSLQLWQWTAKA